MAAVAGRGNGNNTYYDGNMHSSKSLTTNVGGYTIDNGIAINSTGQIVADAITPSGVEHAVLLTPTAAPLPSEAWAALGAIPMMLLGGRFLRRHQSA